MAISVENQERLSSLKVEDLRIIVNQFISDDEKNNVKTWNKATLINRIVNSDLTDEELESLLPVQAQDNTPTTSEDTAKSEDIAKPEAQSDEPSATTLKNMIAEMRKTALEPVVVTITCLDEKDISMNKECETFSIENGHFSVGKVVPFNIPVEIPRALVDAIREIKMSKVIALSDEQQRLQKRLSVVTRVPRYNVAIMDREALGTK